MPVGLGAAEELRIVIKGQDQFSGQLKKQTSVLEKMHQHIGKIGAAMAIGGTVAIAWLSKIGAETVQVRKAYTEMANSMGQDAGAMLRSIRELAGGTISELEAMAAANRAMLTGVKPDVILKSMQIARAAATATGTSVLEAFERITGGIARMESELLKTVGINARMEEANKIYADSIGKTVSQLTMLEKQQAWTNAVLQQGEMIIERVGEAGSKITELEIFQQLTASINDLKSAIGEALLPVVLPLIKALTEIVNKLKEHPEVIKNVIIGLTALGAAIITAKAIMAAFNAVASMNPILLIGMAVAIPIVIKLLDQLKDKFEEVTDAAYDVKEQWEDVQARIDATITTASVEELTILRSELEAVAEQMEEIGRDPIGLENYLSKIDAKIAELGETAAEVAEEITLLDTVMGKLAEKEQTLEEYSTDVMEALINQERVEKKKWMTSEQFGDVLRQLGVAEEYVAKAMEDGYIELTSQDEVLAALGQNYVDYILKLQESYDLLVEHESQYKALQNEIAKTREELDLLNQQYAELSQWSVMGEQELSQFRQFGGARQPMFMEMQFQQQLANVNVLSEEEQALDDILVLRRQINDEIRTEGMLLEDLQNKTTRARGEALSHEIDSWGY